MGIKSNCRRNCKTNKPFFEKKVCLFLRLNVSMAKLMNILQFQQFTKRQIFKSDPYIWLRRVIFEHT